MFPYALLRPALFALDPETAHELTIAALSKAGPLAGLACGKTAGREVEVMGLRFPNPVGLAAGLDKNGEAIDGLAALGFGFIEIGTVTPRPQPGNPKPRMFRLPEAEAIINRMGFNNHGVAALVENVKRAKYRGILGINIGKAPHFLELLTYRYRGHSMSDSRGYRTREEEEMWKQRDPIYILRDRLIAEKAMTMADYEAMEKEIDAYIENEVIKFAEESPEPKVEELEKYVLADRESQMPWITGKAA